MSRPSCVELMTSSGGMTDESNGLTVTEVLRRDEGADKSLAL
jgi:hypothetical protein